MTASAPRAEYARQYARRLHRVQQPIEAHLGQPLDLTELAAVAHFSPFHFHRVFTAWTGETVGDFLRRRRLEGPALRLLTQPRSTVLDIALTVGFGSGEAFARVFQSRFCCSATQWRRAKAEQRAVQMRKLGQAQGNLDQADNDANHEHGQAHTGYLEPPMQTLSVKVIDRPAARVAYLRHIGPYGPAVAAFWQQQLHPFLARHGLYGRPIYGLSHDDPDITAADKCRYDTCVEVDDNWLPVAGALVTVIPAGRYAAMPFKGTSATIGAAWQAMMRDWLPASGYQIDSRPTFEYCASDAAYDEATKTFSCELVIPLAPL